MNDQNGTAQPTPTQLRVTTTWQDGCRVVAAAGELDLTNNHRLHAALSLAMQPDQPLIADLSRITYLDSHGLSTLQLSQRNAALQGARLLIVPSPAIAAILALSAVDTALSVCPGLSQALAAARSSAQTGDAPAPA
jgi:anti-anti-sigma factor